MTEDRRRTTKGRRDRCARPLARAVYVLAALGLASSVPAQGTPTTAAPKTILAIGAHAGDMELTAGAVLIKQRQLGDRAVLLHLTLGERGHPTLDPSAYAEQKRREAQVPHELWAPR